MMNLHGIDIDRSAPSFWSGRFGLIVLLLAFASGCAHRELTGRFTNSPPPEFSDSGESVTPDRWWIVFGDAGLDRRVEEALDGNFDIAAAYQRLAAARALARREASDLYPDVDGVADIASVFGPGRDRTAYTWGLDASYPVDLWGEIEARVDAERLRASATKEDYHAIALTLSADIATVWFSLIEAHAQAGLVEEQIQTNLTGLRAQELRWGVNAAQSPDVLRQQQLVESTREQAVIVKSRIEVLEHQLAVLLGEMPQDASYVTGDVLPGLPPLPATGVPSELLQRRPDVRRGYLAFMAADRDLASAITRQYPRLNLTGSLLNIADSPDNLFRDWFLGIGAQLIGPLVDGGERRAEVDRQTALVRQRFNEYGDTMLNAFREVEDALALERNQLERIELLERQLELAIQSTDRIRDFLLFGVEGTNYLDFLSAIQAQQRLQRELLSARLELLLIRVGLYLALAGGYDTCPQLPPDEYDPTSAGDPTPADSPRSNSDTTPLKTLTPDREAVPAPAAEPVMDVGSTTTTGLELEQLLRSIEQPSDLKVNE